MPRKTVNRPHQRGNNPAQPRAPADMERHTPLGQARVADPATPTEEEIAKITILDLNSLDISDLDPTPGYCGTAYSARRAGPFPSNRQNSGRETAWATK